MKKYTAILSIFILALSFMGLLAFNVKSADAYDSGCVSGAIYSMTTGQLCSSTTYVYGACAPGNLFSTVTGLPCTGYSSGGTTVNSQFYRELRIGSVGSDVLQLQQLLQQQGYYTGSLDNIYGRRTSRAVKDFQFDNNIAVTGVADMDTLTMVSAMSGGQGVFVYPCALTNNIYGNSNCPPIQNSQAPVVSGVNGPQSLGIGQQGSWTVSAYDVSGNTLSYAVTWGDEQYFNNYNPSASLSLLSQQSATFTHTYYNAGTYTPMFTVTNQFGRNSKTSLSVSVGGSVYNQNVSISSITPSSGRSGTQVTIYGTGFGNNCAPNTCQNFYAPVNTVNFGSNVIQNIYSSNGTSLTFTVPYYATPACLYSNPPCAVAQMQIPPGTYPVSITNSSGTSNTVNFIVTY